MQTPSVTFKRYELNVIDQTLLPHTFQYIQLSNLQESYQAIKTLKVRGAPLIGIVAAYSLVICAHNYLQKQSADGLIAYLDKSAKHLNSSRPTAVNLAWAIQRMKQVYGRMQHSTGSEIIEALSTEAEKIHDEDHTACRNIGLHGASVLSKGSNILTHCNTGSLATGGWGTALGIIYAAQEQGLDPHVYVDETRPLGQGARLTLWELMQNKIPCTLITDSMAAALMQEGKIDVVLFGADRITRNGDIANKIGSYGLAVLARAHKISCYAAAPVSTFDLSLDTGKQIPIEQRDANEILQFYEYDRKIAGLIRVHNPAFDVTPAELISGIVTERGILKPPIGEAITKLIT